MSAVSVKLLLGVLSLIGILGAAALGNWDSIASNKAEAAISAPPSPPAATPSISNSGSGSVVGVNYGTNTVVNSVPPVGPCRDKSHGVESYGRTFDVPNVSPWMGGGFSQKPYCDQVIAGLRGQHPDGVFEVLSMGERSHSTCKPFNCPQYQYTCNVRVKTDPVYVEKDSSACRRY